MKIFSMFVSGREGSPVTLRCEASGVPPPTIQVSLKRLHSKREHNYTVAQVQGASKKSWFSGKSALANIDADSKKSRSNS